MGSVRIRMRSIGDVLCERSQSAIYDMPPLAEREVQSLIHHGSSSDSFYFVNGKLIMHNKAKYQYVDSAPSGAASKKA